MRIVRVTTTTGKYEMPIRNKLEAANVLLTLHRLGIVCVRWEVVTNAD